MASIEFIVSELKTLPPAQLEEAAAYIHNLRRQTQDQTVAALRQTAGIITAEEADEWLRNINTFEHIDESSW